MRYLTQDHAEQAAAANRLIDRECTADFPDYCILFANREAGCPLTYSFDRKPAQHPETEIPEA